MHRTLLPALVALLLSGCAGSPSHRPVPAPAPAQVAKQITEAAISPLNDLNLVEAKIPPVLHAARKATYRPTEGCEAIAAELGELDEALGADIDAPKGKREDPNLLERGVVAAEDAAVRTAVGMVRTTTDIIPFRPWVRKLTGAERASKEVASAISAGTHRRAFLKGMAVGAGCPPPPPTAKVVVNSEPEAQPEEAKGAWPAGLD